MAGKRPDCDQYTVMVGLVDVTPELLGDDGAEMDLTLAREVLMNRVLNFNNYLRDLFNGLDAHAAADKPAFSTRITDYVSKTLGFGGAKAERPLEPVHMASTSIETAGESPELPAKYATLVSRLRGFNRNEFFVYSVSLSFNPSIRSVADLLKPTSGGGIVFTITAKMPVDDRKRTRFLRILLRYISRTAVLLDVKAERAPVVDAILSRARVVPEQPAAEPQAVLKPVPRYFDEDYTDEDAGEKPPREPAGPYPYSFFRHSSYMLSKYATSTLVPREDEEAINRRLLQLKLQKSRKARS